MTPLINHYFTVNSLEKNAVNITDCSSHWNGSLFNYTIQWTIPQYLAHGDGIFSQFSLTVDEINEKRTKRFIRSDTVPKVANQTKYNFTWINVEPIPLQYVYEFKVYSYEIIRNNIVD